MRHVAFSVSLLSTILGGAVALAGIVVMVQAGSFASGSAEQSHGFLGLWGSGSQSADVPTAPWVGLLCALAGFAMMGFGLRAMVDAADS